MPKMPESEKKEEESAESREEKKEQVLPKVVISPKSIILISIILFGYVCLDTWCTNSFVSCVISISAVIP